MKAITKDIVAKQVKVVASRIVSEFIDGEFEHPYDTGAAEHDYLCELRKARGSFYLLCETPEEHEQLLQWFNEAVEELNFGQACKTLHTIYMTDEEDIDHE